MNSGIYLLFGRKNKGNNEAPKPKARVEYSSKHSSLITRVTGIISATVFLVAGIILFVKERNIPATISCFLAFCALIFPYAKSIPPKTGDNSGEPKRQKLKVVYAFENATEKSSRNGLIGFGLMFVIAIVLFFTDYLTPSLMFFLAAILSFLMPYRAEVPDDDEKEQS